MRSLNYYRVRIAYRERAVRYWFTAQVAYITGQAPYFRTCGWCKKQFHPVPYQTVKYLRHRYIPNACPNCR